MKKAGYRPETAAAISSAAATIGPIIPPSLPMVIYGVSADASIGKLFLGGVIPGILMGLSLMVLVAIIAPRRACRGTRSLGFAKSGSPSRARSGRCSRR
jgi:TRAP-type C4-dicarboxylate transport system permease large subunit